MTTWMRIVSTCVIALTLVMAISAGYLAMFCGTAIDWTWAFVSAMFTMSLGGWILDHREFK